MMLICIEFKLVLVCMIGLLSVYVKTYFLEIWYRAYYCKTF